MKALEVVKNSKYLPKIENIYLSSFPESERIEFSAMVNRKFQNSNLYALTDNKKLVGFTYISCYEDIVYIIYLAIDENERNKQLGSLALKEIDKLYPNKTKVLCVEKPTTDDEMKAKRISFYKKNGFKFASFEFDFLGQTYYTMHKGKLNEEIFKEFLLICFPGCKNFKNILNFEELNQNNLEFAIKLQNNIFPLENGSEDLKENAGNRVPSHLTINREWLAKAGKEYVGITGIYAYKIAPNDAWLGWFGVAEKARGNGYATQILNWTINKVKQLGFETLRLYTDEEDNAEAVKLYKKFGFISEVYNNPEDVHFEISKTLIFSKNLSDKKTTLWNNKYLGLGAHDKKNEVK